MTEEEVHGGVEVRVQPDEQDDEQVPETGRVLVVTPATYLLMKQCKDITMETDIGNDMRIRGVIANLDGLTGIKIKDGFPAAGEVRFHGGPSVRNGSPYQTGKLHHAP